MIKLKLLEDRDPLNLKSWFFAHVWYAVRKKIRNALNNDHFTGQVNVGRSCRCLEREHIVQSSGREMEIFFPFGLESVQMCCCLRILKKN